MFITLQTLFTCYWKTANTVYMFITHCKHFKCSMKTANSMFIVHCKHCLYVYNTLQYFSLASLNKHPKLSTLRSLYPMHNLSHPLPLPKILVSSSTQPFPFLSRSPPFQVPITTISSVHPPHYRLQYCLHHCHHSCSFMT